MNRQPVYQICFGNIVNYFAPLVQTSKKEQQRASGENRWPSWGYSAISTSCVCLWLGPQSPFLINVANVICFKNNLFIIICLLIRLIVWPHRGRRPLDLAHSGLNNRHLLNRSEVRFGKWRRRSRPSRARRSAWSWWPTRRQTQWSGGAATCSRSWRCSKRSSSFLRWKQILRRFRSFFCTSQVTARLFFFKPKPPLPPWWLLLGSPMLMDPHPSQQHAGLQWAV